VIGAFALSNIYDAAYGNKMLRVVRETEHLLEHERGRFCPPKQAPFRGVYSEDEAADLGAATPVGELWPSFLPMSRSADGP